MLLDEVGKEKEKKKETDKKDKKGGSNSKP